MKKASKRSKENSKKAGRPTKRTDERVAILLDALSDNMPRELACNFAQINRTTFYRWLKENEDFATQVTYAESQGRRDLITAVQKKDPWKILKNMESDHFKEHVEITGSETRELIINLTGDTWKAGVQPPQVSGKVIESLPEPQEESSSGYQWNPGGEEPAGSGATEVCSPEPNGEES